MAAQDIRPLPVTIQNTDGTTGATTAAGSQSVVPASDAGPFPTSDRANAAAGGISNTARLQSSAASTNATVVKVGAGRVYGIYGQNVSTGPRYIRFFDKATTPVSGTDVPKFTRVIPATSTFAYDWNDLGYSFALGITYDIVQQPLDNSTAGIAAGDILSMNVDYA